VRLLRLAVLPRWARRLVTVPATFLAFVWLLGLLPLWLLVAAAVSLVVPGTWRPLRLLWFAIVWLAIEVAALTAAFVLWVASGLGWKIRSPGFVRAHVVVLGTLLRFVGANARFTFGLRYDHRDVGLDEAPPDRPLLVFSRHSGAGDSLLLVTALMNGAVRRRPLIVLKDFLQLDPTVDVYLNRLGASFVGSAGKGGERVVAEIAALAAQCGPTDALVLFPEGGNFTQSRRRKAIEQLDLIGRPDLAARARELEHLLPPKPLGALTAITHAPTATVVFVGHVGLEALTTPRDVWRHMPTGVTVHTTAWRVPADDIPPEAERELWLYDWWETIDTWIDEVFVVDALTVADNAA
jgi:hypothetical protein